jgi:alpha-L-fucosidase
MIVNNRVDVHRGGMGGFSQSSEAVGDFSTPEQEIPATGMPGVDWETCMTMNDHWGYNARDKHFKSSAELIRMLVDIASKGGNYLLNVGPTAEGSFPPESIERLRDIGQWMKTNGSSIYDTRASVFGSLPFGRCTVRVGDEHAKIYLHVFDWPETNELELPGLANEPQRAYLLAAPDRELAVSKRHATVRIALPERAPDPVCSVVVLEVDGKPVVHKAPEIRAAADEFVRPLTVTIANSSPRFGVRYTLDGAEPTHASALYEHPIVLLSAAIVKARVFDAERAVSPAATRSFVKVTPRPPVEAAPQQAGLSVARFEGDWDRLPEWSALEAKETTSAPNVTLRGSKDEHVALRFSGFLDVPLDDEYVFALESDDGSRLSIDGQVVIDNDGAHVPAEKRAAIALAKGLHAIEVGWFNRTGGAVLSLRWTELGGDLHAIPDASLRH